MYMWKVSMRLLMHNDNLTISNPCTRSAPMLLSVGNWCPARPPCPLFLVTRSLYTPTSAPSRLLSNTRYQHRVSAVECGLIACVSPYPTQSICAPFPICPASVLYPPRLCHGACFLFRLARASLVGVVRWLLYSNILAYIAMQLTFLIRSPVFQHFLLPL